MNLSYEEIVTSIEIIQKEFEKFKEYLKDKEDLLKNIAASAIHITMFMADLWEFKSGTKFFNISDLDLIKMFIENCGCNMDKKVND